MTFVDALPTVLRTAFRIEWPKFVPAEPWCDFQPGQDQQIPAEAHLVDQVGSVDGEHLADVCDLLVDGVQCQEEVDDASVGDDVQLGLADGHFLAVAIVLVVPGLAL